MRTARGALKLDAINSGLNAETTGADTPISRIVRFCMPPPRNNKPEAYFYRRPAPRQAVPYITMLVHTIPRPWQMIPQNFYNNCQQW